MWFTPVCKPSSSAVHSPFWLHTATLFGIYANNFFFNVILLPIQIKCSFFTTIDSVAWLKWKQTFIVFFVKCMYIQMRRSKLILKMKKKTKQNKQLSYDKNRDLPYESLQCTRTKIQQIIALCIKKEFRSFWGIHTHSKICLNSCIQFTHTSNRR